MGNAASNASKQSDISTAPTRPNQNSGHGQGEPSSTSSSNPTQEKPKCKPCCACPETKRARDACIVENGEENCQDLIEAHRKCMRDMGFNI